MTACVHGALTGAMGRLARLCTDGFSDALPEGEIRQHLSSRTSAEDIFRILAAAALIKGAGDDLTTIVARFGEAA